MSAAGSLEERLGEAEDRLASEMDAHEWVETEDFCNCGHYVGARMPSVHKWHLAAALAPVVADEVRRAVEGALREAADDYYAGRPPSSVYVWLNERASAASRDVGDGVARGDG